jgi:hypothetical protein
VSGGIGLGVQAEALLKNSAQRGQNQNLRRDARSRCQTERPTFFLYAGVESDVGGGCER